MKPILQAYIIDFNRSDNLLDAITNFFTVHNDIETLNHTLKVASEAQRVAKLYDVDPAKAEQAALLHDISNVIPISDMLHVAEELSIEIMDEERKYSRIVHQKLSRAMAEEVFGVTDSEILCAIECHTTLKANSSLFDKIIFISDKISWELPGNHQYLTDIRSKVDELELIEGILIYLNNIWDQKTKLKLIHPWLIEAREELLKKISHLPSGLSKPAQRALSGSGLWKLEQISKLSEAELLQLHGLGSKSIRQIREALEMKGLSFSNKS
ncbi:bis(5'-nucleosyl)-tetraphosphatase (symmetrical) YqeK [Cohnella luojiensis]|uniref:bis(5'-nucleosyl)-tetraphosphatase (symmetrical) n=1 Tax=Cohnella luojiensis TaxID=652876 RepID=A0A4Y8LSN8_9BACL|nr:bis(5'-nucleosyl)-tetraphosphatase (symmetrical) YqeK [Cohnella luojiensis]TFE19661.1 HD domain-containing protein [Cohnella luojiensis]